MAYKRSEGTGTNRRNPGIRAHQLVSTKTDSFVLSCCQNNFVYESIVFVRTAAQPGKERPACSIHGAGLAACLLGGVMVKRSREREAFTDGAGGPLALRGLWDYGGPVVWSASQEVASQVPVVA
ncbi:hypothetical protein THAOC_16045 [Thalassiosira oceanica]|uniref:Uncharacterized protein n=1 Tax=Thalassiosira oceanica TaxID=159749 RepID=K0SEB3_THAOC|nr:hypothetical protein THAOC_16045 [Thalassiosira oceanica]|eukprot:EJK63304.1 hypothetical protein THAOC_16045 [Thalassiosira oceanica]